MVKQVYSFQDLKVCIYHPPMVLLNDAEALRLAKDCVADSQTPMSRHPEDFRLMRIGEFDDNTGFVKALHSPEVVWNLVRPRTPGQTEDVLIKG